MDLERTVAGLVERSELRFFGKYRGSVVDNDDPARLGRLRLRVPSVTGPEVVTGWATPCVPYGGTAGLGLLCVPEKEAGVWVEYEEGDLEFPVWTGTYWVKQPQVGSQLPRPLTAKGEPGNEVQRPPTRKIFTTRKGHTLQFEDADGEEAVVLRDGEHGQLVVLDGDGISVTDRHGNTAVLDTDGIRLTDANGNELAMAGDGLTLTAATPLTIDAAGQPVSVVCASLDITKG
ncbi:phage baseplate assembly protein V [Streptomyces sp. ODS28]|uniref:phage baseplate assembly protein V n=1 Tax=Streptomyces sp. ODS28 TaxID=3136688 RepID=UPI0031E9F6BB